MTNIPISQETETNQENDITIETQTSPKRKERPPLALISAGGEIVEKPSKGDILDEIQLLVIAPIRAIYALLSESNEFPADYPEGTAAISGTLFVALEHWKRLSGYL